MKTPELVSFSAMLPEFRSGRRTPRDFLEECLSTIERLDSRVKAFVVLNPDGARKAADASGKRYKAGTVLSPVDGCPVGIKDIIATADMPTQMNSPIFRGWQSGQDAACVHALRKGGAVILGKTVTTEFAFGESGPTTNPHDPSRTPGGSSSGTAAAVGAGMMPVGLGTQTGGSTLRPASYCGAVGYKPTIGGLHTGGVHPLSSTCDHLGVIGSSLGDVWRTASQISLGIGSPSYGFLTGAGEEPPRPLRPRRLIWLRTPGWKEIDAGTEAAFQNVLTTLRDSEVEIVSKDEDERIEAFEYSVETRVRGAIEIQGYEMRWPFLDYIARYGDKVGPRVREVVAQADRLTADDYKERLTTRRDVLEQCQQLVTDVAADALITLSSSGPAPKGLAHTGSRSFLTWASWLGLPAFSLPLMECAGLPVGVQILGMPRTDGTLCAHAHWMMRERVEEDDF